MAGKGSSRGRGGRKAGGGRKGSPRPRRAADRAGGTGSMLSQWVSASPSLALGLFCTLPVWLLYELAQLSGVELPLNGAERWIHYVFGALRHGETILRLLAGVAVCAAGVLLIRRRVPLFRLGPLVVAEGLAWGSIIGPLGLLVAYSLSAGARSFWPVDFYVSLGAGFYEELLFRLFLHSLVQLLLLRAFAFHGAPPLAAISAAALLSGLLFALAHHLGPGMPPPEFQVILFRTVLGFLLGLLFVFRGFGVVVYAHVWYDIIYFFFTRS